MSSTFKGKNPMMWGLGNPANFASEPEPPPLPPDPKKKAEEAASEEARRLKRRKGMGSTILTSPQGIVDEPLGAQ